MDDVVLSCVGVKYGVDGCLSQTDSKACPTLLSYSSGGLYNTTRLKVTCRLIKNENKQLLNKLQYFKLL